MTDHRRRFEDNTAIVTGSTRGIGAGIARRLAAEGATVVITGRSQDPGKALAGEISGTDNKAEFVRADVRDPDDIVSLFEGTRDQFGRIDVLVNNAAVETETTADEVGLEEWTKVVETNFRGYWLCAKHAYRHMDSGAIVNISSNHAYHTMPEMFPYNAVKAGIEGMTRAMALDFGPSVRVNSVTPGWVAVERTVADMDDDYRDHLEEIHPVGRIGRPEDVASAVAYLASDDASFVTGSCLLVDGGRGAVMQDDTLSDYSASK